MSAVDNSAELNNNQDFAIVGIGASAGGLRAIEDFFDNMPADTGAAFVVIQHLSPDFKSLMHELLERRTKMDVCVATEGMPLRTDTIFLIPPGQNMALVDNALHLTPQERGSARQQPHFPIDLFFQSLASEGKERIISIVLSGTGSDGTRGIQHVSEAGGIVLVQEPSSAEFDGMPRSAIETGRADLVLPPHSLATTTYQFVGSASQREAFKAHQSTQLNPVLLSEIVSILETYENIDFSQYKSNTLTRRIQRRCMIAGHDTLDSYIQALQTSAIERSTLRDDLLITVTRFFRDTEAWNLLQHQTLPALIDRAQAQTTLRIWVTACATGEEAYSFAMMMHELITARKSSVKVKIFATDVDQIALAKASAGVYPLAAIADLSAERRDRFFNIKDNQVEVSRALRESIIFAHHNLTKDASFTQMDLVSCRNVLIYMQPELQQQVLRNLHFSLKLNSILFLGESENLGELEDEFSIQNKKWNIYQKLRDIRLPFVPPQVRTLNPIPVDSRILQRQPASPRFDPLLETAFSSLLRNRQATCFLVDRDNQLLHLCGDSLKLLQVVSGRASQDVLKMLPKSLHLPVSTAMHRARQKDAPVTYGNCPVTEEESNLGTLKIEVSQQKSTEVGNFLMVTIEKESIPDATELPEQFVNNTATAQYILQLQQELQATRETLQATIEELETTNEEQQSTNEELIASNEELQSTNEELHSVNEELHTVNSEYQSKIQELVQLNNDLDNLLTNIDIGVIYLDQNLKIRKFTPAATIAFNLVSSDVGRPLEHLAHSLENVEISEILATAQAQQTVSEHKIRIKRDGPHLLMQIHPYQNEEKAIEGLIITLIDINDIQVSKQELTAAQADLRRINERLEAEVKERTAALESSQQMLKSVTQATPNAIYIYDLISRSNVYANTFLERLLGYNLQEIQELGEKLNDHLFHPDDYAQIEAHHQRILDSQQDDSYVFEIEYRIRNASNEWRYFYSKDIVFKRSPDGKPLQILGTAVDISDRKNTLLKLQNSEARYRALYQSTPVMMHSVDHQGIILSVNNTWLKRLGYQKHDVIGKHISNFVTCSLRSNHTEQNRQTSEQAVQTSPNQPPDNSCFPPEGCHELPCTIISHNNEVIDVLLSAVAEQDFSSNVTQLLSVMVEVTQRNKAEAELTKYREHLEELVSMRADEINQSNQRLREEVKDRQQAQSELAQRAKALERSNAALEEFAYVVSHDLQEPLRAMTVFSQLLDQRYQEKLDTTASGYIHNIVEGGIRMQALIDGILDFSRITHRGQNLQEVDFNTLIKGVTSGLKTTLEANQTNITVDPLPTLMADYNQISQLFQNLISNAIKFKRGEPPTIHISAVLLDDKPNDSETSRNQRERWQFSVQDNGIGISPEQQERIFALFQRLHTRQELEGYGIGLAICKKIVERHSGNIWVESEPQKGATFFFTLSPYSME